MPYGSTDNLGPPIPVSDWLIFCRGNFIFHQKGNENDKNTNFMMKKNNKKKSHKKHCLSELTPLTP